MSTDETARTGRVPDRLVVPSLIAVMILALAGGWVLSGVLVRDTPPLAVAAGRTGSSFLVITAVALASRRMRADVVRAGRRWPAVPALAVLGFLVYYVGTLTSVELAGASTTNVIVSLLPCITFGIGILAFRERATLRKGLGTLLAVAAAVGYAVVAGRWDTGGASAAVLLTALAPAFVGTCTYALYGYVYQRRMSDVSPIAALPAVTGVAFAVLLPVAALATPLGDVSASAWLGTAVLGALLTAPVFLVSHELIRRRGPLFTSAVALVVPLLVSVGEAAVGDGPWPGAAATALIVVCCLGVWLVVSSPREQRTAAVSPAPERTSSS
ncbi:MAG: DMT family transporter [Pseudonocardia sediminis]